MLADMLISMALEGSPRAFDMILERTEGRVPMALPDDTEIVVIHRMPAPKPVLAAPGEELEAAP